MVCAPSWRMLAALAVFWVAFGSCERLRGCWVCDLIICWKFGVGCSRQNPKDASPRLRGTSIFLALAEMFRPNAGQLILDEIQLQQNGTIIATTGRFRQCDKRSLFATVCGIASAQRSTRSHLDELSAPPYSGGLSRGRDLQRAMDGLRTIAMAIGAATGL